MKMVIAALLLFEFGTASAQMTLADEQRLADIERAQATLKNLDASLDVMIKKREADCRRAIGYAPFCGCVMEEPARVKLLVASFMQPAAVYRCLSNAH